MRSQVSTCDFEFDLHVSILITDLVPIDFALINSRIQFSEQIFRSQDYFLAVDSQNNARFRKTGFVYCTFLHIKGTCTLASFTTFGDCKSCGLRQVTASF